jgi:hypothetical protein
MPLPVFARVVPFGLIGLLATTAPTSALAGNESRSQAFPLPDQLFEVIADFSESSIYWCGAGTYAQTTLSKPQRDKIYVWQGPSASAAKPGQKSVRFGFRPPPGASLGSSLSTDVKIVGNALSVSQAREKCNERTSSG